MTPTGDHAEPSLVRKAPAKRGGSFFDRSSLTGYPESVQKLIEEFTRLPGIGRRSAERLVFHVLKSSPGEAESLAAAIREVKAKVGHCRVCYNLLDRTQSRNGEDGPALCSICADAGGGGGVGGGGGRKHGTVMVVEQPKDLISLEQTGMYKGGYHVLMGRISPLEGVGPGDLTVDELLGRVRDATKNAQGVPVEEVILALNPTLESDGTALYLAEELGKARRKKSEAPVRVTRLARGVPTGLQLEYANKAVLADAIEGRRPMS